MTTCMKCGAQVLFMTIVFISLATPSTSAAVATGSLMSDTTIPPPPPDGGAKTVIESDQGLGNNHPQLKPEVDSPTIVPYLNTVFNSSLPVPEAVPEGKAGFGGPLAAQNEVVEKENEKEDEAATLNGDKGEKRHGLNSCRVCPPGFGVISACTADVETICARCPQSSFRKGHSATDTCTQCSSCPPGFYQRAPCVSDSDTLCGACHSHGNGYGNEDFLRQCEGAVPPTTSITTASTDTPVPETPVATSPSTTVTFVKKATEAPTVDIVPFAGEPQVGEAHSKDKQKPTPVKSGGFQWPILLAIIISGVVFFIVGAVASMMLKRRAQKKESNDTSIQDTSYRRTNNGYMLSDASSPLTASKTGK